MNKRTGHYDEEVIPSNWHGLLIPLEPRAHSLVYLNWNIISLELDHFTTFCEHLEQLHSSDAPNLGVINVYCPYASTNSEDTLYKGLDYILKIYFQWISGIHTLSLSKTNYMENQPYCRKLQWAIPNVLDGSCIKMLIVLTRSNIFEQTKAIEFVQNWTYIE